MNDAARLPLPAGRERRPALHVDLGLDGHAAGSVVASPDEPPQPYPPSTSQLEHGHARRRHPPRPPLVASSRCATAMAVPADRLRHEPSRRPRPSRFGSASSRRDLTNP